MDARPGDASAPADSCAPLAGLHAEHYDSSMSPRLKQILDEALTLSGPERAELAVELAASVDGNEDPDASAAWAVEIERRARRALAGESRGKDWESVRARIEKNIRSG